MKKNSFKEGAFIATFAIIFTKIIGIIYVIPFYKIIGDKGGALYGYAYTMYSTFLLLSTVGVPLAMSKLVSEYNAKGYTNLRLPGSLKK
jgi:O-antigen/teichoic acid export membrane protein